MDIPTIGRARGIFEIYIPGLFLLINIIGFLYYLPYADKETKTLLASITANWPFSFVLAIVFGYLIGVLLRLVHANPVDIISAGFLRLLDHLRIPTWVHKEYKKNNKKHSEAVTDKFPYISWLGFICEKYLPPETLVFYKETWGKRAIREEKEKSTEKEKRETNRQYFDFCKVIVISKDELCVNEIFVAESLVKYIAGMFYALMISVSLLIILLSASKAGEVPIIALWVVFSFYLLAIFSILLNFRSIRIKEVETLFAVTFKYKDELHFCYEDKINRSIEKPGAAGSGPDKTGTGTHERGAWSRISKLFKRS